MEGHPLFCRVTGTPRQQSSIKDSYDCELSGHKNECRGLLARRVNMTQFADGVIYTAFRWQRSPCLAILCRY